MDGKGDPNLTFDVSMEGESEDERGTERIEDLFRSRDRTLTSEVRYDALPGAFGLTGRHEESSPTKRSSKRQKEKEWKEKYLPRRICFNCFLEGHILAECAIPIDRNRVNASRRAYTLEKERLVLGAEAAGEEDPVIGDEGDGDGFHGRFWDGMIEREERRRMAEKFEPGRFSEELEEALRDPKVEEVGEGIWKGMLVWGYPPGFWSSQGSCSFTGFSELLANKNFLPSHPLYRSERKGYEENQPE